MAKQVGPLFFTGTIDGLIFYKLGDKYFTRSKGSYKSARHMRRNPKYKRTMQQADRFGEASHLLKEVYYRYLPKAVRKHGLYGKLTGLINTWLYQGKSKEEVKELLLAHCQQLAAAVKPVAASKAKAATPIVNQQRPTNNTQQPTRRVKQARYLSKWKVKRSGRLHIPQSAKPSTTEMFMRSYVKCDLVPNPELVAPSALTQRESPPSITTLPFVLPSDSEGSQSDTLEVKWLSSIYPLH